jgi:hypothetical protein
MAWDRSAKLGGPDDLAIALAQNLDLTAVVLNGYHDLQANYLMSTYVLEQSVRGPDARKRVLFGICPGGRSAPGSRRAGSAPSASTSSSRCARGCSRRGRALPERRHDPPAADRDRQHHRTRGAAD